MRPVVIVGAGPAGYASGLQLASFGVECAIVEQNPTVAGGSRATGISRRALQLLTPSGVADRVMEVAVVQRANRAFVGDRELFTDWTPPEPGKYPRIVNLQQDRFEELLLEAVGRHPSIEMRWGRRVVGVDPGPEAVDVEIDGPSGTERLEASWVVACDGARSTLRRRHGLEMQGERYETRFVVVDVHARLDLTDGVRRIWFDPPSNPGGTVIMHQQTRDVWRIDFGIPPDADRGPDAAAVREVVRAHLRLLGEPSAWEIVWSGDYTASSVSLATLRRGRTLFAGDAAHLVPIFGGRGLNSAIEDGFNLGWKLAAVLRGAADEALLDTYSAERVEGAVQNSSKAGIGAEVIAAHSPGSLLLRRAALGLMLTSRPSLKSLLDHRTADANTYAGSPLNLEDGCSRGDATTARPGSAMPDMLAARPGDGSAGYLVDAAASGFTVLDVGVASAGEADAPPASLLGLPTRRLAIEPEPLDGPPAAGGAPYPRGRYLVRPDLYVMGCREGPAGWPIAGAMPFATGEAES